MEPISPEKSDSAGRAARIAPHGVAGQAPARTGTACLITAALGLAGCVSLETAAPLMAPSAGGDLASGRSLYIGKCAKCHAVEPVLKYTAGEWAVIMPDMAERTKLSPGETAAVTAYVAAVLRQGQPAAGG